MIVFQATGKSLVEEFKVDAGVEIAVFLPSDVYHTLLREAQRSLTVGGCDLVEVGITELTDVVVALFTIAGFEFKLVYPACLWEPGFLVHNPGTTERPEVTPAVVGSEA